MSDKTSTATKTEIQHEGTPTQKDAVTKKLRDIGLGDLDSVVGGIGARCDMDGAPSLE
jgi:hypothetical protein